jgi:hypothetical protein
VRAGLTQRLTPAAALAQAVLLAAVFQLTVSGTSDLGSAWIDRGRTVASAQPGWISLVLGLATLAAIAGAWSGPPWSVAALALATAGLWLSQAPARPPGQVILTVLALAVITILALRRRRLPRAWLWLAGALYLVLQLRWVFPGAVPLGALPTWLIILAATTAWCAVDMGPMLATALFMAAQFGTAFLSLMQPSGLGASDGVFWQNAAVAAGSAGLAIAAIRRLRRHAAL